VAALLEMGGYVGEMSGQVVGDGWLSRGDGWLSCWRWVESLEIGG
jgi:hypothetical protein